MHLIVQYTHIPSSTLAINLFCVVVQYGNAPSHSCVNVIGYSKKNDIYASYESTSDGSTMQTNINK